MCHHTGVIISMCHHTGVIISMCHHTGVIGRYSHLKQLNSTATKYNE